MTLALPLLGLLLLGGALAVLADDQLTVSYRGQEYAGGRIVAAAEVQGEALPTDDRVAGKQVWRPTGTEQEDELYLQLADGRFQVFRRKR